MSNGKTRAGGLAWTLRVLAFFVSIDQCQSGRGWADTIVLKNGIVYRGRADRDETIYWISDNVKRIVIRESKISKILSDNLPDNSEPFDVRQPLEKHAGAMPKIIQRVFADPWSDRGRRRFEYEGVTAGRVVRMEQAIHEIGPYFCRVRGVDEFWKSTIATSEVPKEIVLAIVNKVDRTIDSQRFRVVRFLIKAEMYDEAIKELDYLLKLFPDDPNLKPTVAEIRQSIEGFRAGQTQGLLTLAKSAQQPKRLAEVIKSVNRETAPADLVTALEEIDRNLEGQREADQLTIGDLQALAKKLPEDTRKTWKGGLDTVLDAMQSAPDAVRDSLTPWRLAEASGSKTPQAEFALALSGFAVGPEGAVENLDDARAIWDLRDDLQKYLSVNREAERLQILSRIEAVSLSTDANTPESIKRLDTLTKLSLRMPPPLSESANAQKQKEKAQVEADAGGTFRTHEVKADENELPTEYHVAIPPEYHPLRSYPAIVALHDGSGPKQAMSWWAKEASRRGYIVIAPEYLSPGQRNYRYSSSEHAAVELALRDARRRYAIDSNRVFLGGQYVGAEMVWDFTYAHPDLFAGAIAVSALPRKYVYRYLKHANLVPLYVVLADKAPASNEIVFGEALKPLIAKALDITYVEYMQRGPEAFPCEAPAVYDWMDRRRRQPYPKTFDVASARSFDNHYYGMVVNEYDAAKMTPFDLVDELGNNLNPATIHFTSSAMSNLISFDMTGVRGVDIWISPNMIDFRKRLTVKINQKVWFKGMAVLETERFLEDLRIRGDRQQVYWYKLTAK